MHSFSGAIRACSQLNPFQAEIRNAEMKIFASWKNEISLLQFNPNLKQERFTLYLKNQRLLKRIAVKLNKKNFQELQNSLLLCAIAIEERMPKIEQTNQQPFPDNTDVLKNLQQKDNYGHHF